jgi:hypothetical protein
VVGGEPAGAEVHFQGHDGAVGFKQIVSGVQNAVEGSDVVDLALYHTWEDHDQRGGAVLVGADLERSLN